jgi:putative endonuclease
MKYYYTYVLQLIDEDFYIGSCYNLKNRINDHKEGRVNSTKNKRPLKLVYFEGCLSKKHAIKRENQLKTGFGRGYINRRIR